MATGLVTVFGGSGFVGRYVVRDLLAAGWRVRVAVRKPREALYLKPQGNLGQLQCVGADVGQPESLARAAAGADVVINLVGSFGNMTKINRDGAASVAQAAQAAGVKTFVHLSALGADAASPSKYGRSKGEAEAAVRAAFPTAIILRPSVIFGREDKFTNMFAKMIATLPIVPVARAAAKFQPVYVADVAAAVVAAISTPAAAGQSYDLAGPDVVTMSDLQQKLASMTQHQPVFAPIPDALMALVVRATGWLPGAPMNWDQWLMLKTDNLAAAGSVGLAALGVNPTPLEAVAPQWLMLYRRLGRFTPTNQKVSA